MVSAEFLGTRCLYGYSEQGLMPLSHSGVRKGNQGGRGFNCTGPGRRGNIHQVGISWEREALVGQWQKQLLVCLHLWRFSRPKWTKSWVTMSHVIADPALHRAGQEISWGLFSHELSCDRVHLTVPTSWSLSPSWGKEAGGERETNKTTKQTNTTLHPQTTQKTNKNTTTCTAPPSSVSQVKKTLW